MSDEVGNLLGLAVGVALVDRLIFNRRRYKRKRKYKRSILDWD